jgi:hypothetical protein
LGESKRRRENEGKKRNRGKVHLAYRRRKGFYTLKRRQGKGNLEARVGRPLMSVDVEVRFVG